MAPLLGLVGAGVGVALIPKNFAGTQSVAKIVAIRAPHCVRTIWAPRRPTKTGC